MAPETQCTGNESAAEGQGIVEDREEIIEVEHNKTGDPVTIVALKTSGDRDPDLNWITKACATALGFSTKPNSGQQTINIRPVWSFPSEDLATIYHKDEFLVVESASHKVVFGKTVSERILEAKREIPNLAIHVRWIQKGAAKSVTLLPASLAVSIAA